ncbi:hypothetical protein [Streptomyces sp. NPDC058548]|uniref:hypothetical protein n=1 Tax=Streptomyces sp. NPDC058548 TaxID=3346545 RepID=UPI003666BA7D
MPGKTAIASLCGLAAGVAITTASSRRQRGGIGELLLTLAEHALPSAALMLVGLAVAKRWLSAHHDRNRLDITSIADARRRLADEYTAQMRAFATREQELASTAESQRAPLASLAQRLDEAGGLLKTEQLARTQLQNDFDELAAEHNELVLSVMQERANRFAHHKALAPSGRTAAAQGVTQPIHLRPRGVVPVTLPRREHTRAADVGDAR